ncbi:hypothetical protein OF83DRAFT_1173546 [Amylostereum chailletii]|nr:hypothetical protein OF83DRAFT_1173546 [Amylostereum chailletii]
MSCLTHNKDIQRIESPLLERDPQRKGVVVHVYVAKPRDPSPAAHKVARIKLFMQEDDEVVAAAAVASFDVKDFLSMDLKIPPSCQATPDVLRVVQETALAILQQMEHLLDVQLVLTTARTEMISKATFAASFVRPWLVASGSRPRKVPAYE